MKTPPSKALPQRPGKWRRVDARPILAKGQDPYDTLRSAVDSLATGEGLEVTAPFLPSPLIEKLKSEGFQSRVDRPSPGVWRVIFWK